MAELHYHTSVVPVAKTINLMLVRLSNKQLPSMLILVSIAVRSVSKKLRLILLPSEPQPYISPNR